MDRKRSVKRCPRCWRFLTAIDTTVRGAAVEKPDRGGAEPKATTPGRSGDPDPAAGAYERLRRAVERVESGYSTCPYDCSEIGELLAAAKHVCDVTGEGRA